MKRTCVRLLLLTAAAVATWPAATFAQIAPSAIPQPGQPITGGEPQPAADQAAAAHINDLADIVGTAQRSVSGFVNNIEDSAVLSSSPGLRPFTGTAYGLLRTPRTYGVRTSVNI